MCVGGRLFCVGARRAVNTSTLLLLCTTKLFSYGVAPFSPLNCLYMKLLLEPANPERPPTLSRRSPARAVRRARPQRPRRASRLLPGAEWPRPLGAPAVRSERGRGARRGPPPPLVAPARSATASPPHSRRPRRPPAARAARPGRRDRAVRAAPSTTPGSTVLGSRRAPLLRCVD